MCLLPAPPTLQALLKGSEAVNALQARLAEQNQRQFGGNQCIRAGTVPLQDL